METVIDATSFCVLFLAYMLLGELFFMTVRHIGREDPIVRNFLSTRAFPLWFILMMLLIWPVYFVRYFGFALWVFLKNP